MGARGCWNGPGREVGAAEEGLGGFQLHGVNIFHKPFNTLKSMLVHPKDKIDKKDKCGVVYQIPCDSSPSTYIGETARALGERFNEHSKSDKESAVREHTLSSGHSISLENIKILASESRYNPRKIREALEIYKNNPKLNRDQAVISIFQQQSSIRPRTERSKRRQIST